MAELLDVRLPGEQTEGTRAQVLRWLKNVGDAVDANDPLVEIETDKVTMEVPAPSGGVLREILKHAPDEVGPEDVLARLEIAGTAAPVAATAASVTPAATPPAAEAATSLRPRLSPAVRRLLAERGLEPSRIAGSGRGGRITADDVQRASRTDARPEAASPAVPRAAAVVTATSPAAVRDASAVERVPHSATRRRIAERMVESLLKTSPHVTSVFEVDLTAVLADRARQKPEFAAHGVPLTLTAYFVRAAVEAIRAVPEANARWTEDALELYGNVDLGIATAVEGKGLVVPVLRDVHTLDLRTVAQRLADLTARARDDRLTPADVKGGTFTISNHGVSGSLLATPIVINPPQTAILGVGKVEKRVVVVEHDGADAIVVRPRAYVTLTIDHRVMDGHRANRFLSVFAGVLEGWAR